MNLIRVSNHMVSLIKLYVMSCIQGIPQDFGNKALYLLPQSQMNSWISFVCLCMQFEGSSQLTLAQLLTSISTMAGSLW